MYLSEVKLWNFRKYGSGATMIDSENKLRDPDLSAPFTPGLNVLIGENDSGKTSIIDAIKLVLRTHSLELSGIDDDDFYKDSKEFRIECHFSALKPNEAKNFTEWLTIMDDEGNLLDDPSLKVILDVKKYNKKINYEVKAGPDIEGKPLHSDVRSLLQTTYLKPLRDAESDFVPKRNSRLSQILQGHEAFKGEEKDNYLVKIFEEFNTDLRLFFEGKRRKVDDLATQNKIHEPFDIKKEAKQLEAEKAKKEIDKHLKAISDFQSQVEVSPAKLKSILETLSLFLSEKLSGLGTYNKLYIAAELIHLEKSDWTGLRLGLVEEIEAHLHPQAQLRIIEHLQGHNHIQFILTTHSPNLASKVKLENLILCACDSQNKPQVFPLGGKYTELESKDYLFLERFLDVTKSNLFFSRGVIVVEGWSEEMLIPAIAKRIGCDLTTYGVSVVNVGSVALLPYTNIFLRKDENELGTPVSVVTDLDIRAYVYDNKTDDYLSVDERAFHADSKNHKTKLVGKYTKQSVKGFICPIWTLEYALFKSVALSALFIKAVKEVHPLIDWDSNFEKELAKRLIDKSIDKARISYALAQFIESSAFTIQSNDTVYYLVEAIRYACNIKFKLNAIGSLKNVLSNLSEFKDAKSKEK